MSMITRCGLSLVALWPIPIPKVFTHFPIPHYHNQRRIQDFLNGGGGRQPGNKDEGIRHRIGAKNAFGIISLCSVNSSQPIWERRRCWSKKRSLN